jgi:hypothetical protein
MIKNPYKFELAVKQNKFNGLWMIFVEGIVIETSQTEQEAWDWIERTWAPFPKDSLKEIESMLIKELSDFSTLLKQRFKDDEYFLYARMFQRMAKLAEAGVRISLLARTDK